MVLAGVRPGLVGARGDDFRVTGGLVWAPQPAGVAAPGRREVGKVGCEQALGKRTDDGESGHLAHEQEGIVAAR